LKFLRLLQYSFISKIFSPVPHGLSNV
jgi:hypothetical protein